MEDLIQEPILLSLSDLDLEHLTCSKCHKQNITIMGKVFHYYVRQVVNGKVIEYSKDESELLETIDQYICNDCNLVHMIMSLHSSDLMEGSEEFLSIIEE